MDRFYSWPLPLRWTSILSVSIRFNQSSIAIPRRLLPRCRFRGRPLPPLFLSCPKSRREKRFLPAPFSCIFRRPPARQESSSSSCTFPFSDQGSVSPPIPKTAILLAILVLFCFVRLVSATTILSFGIDLALKNNPRISSAVKSCLSSPFVRDSRLHRDRLVPRKTHSPMHPAAMHVFARGETASSS
jgi:hypothetical protein